MINLQVVNNLHKPIAPHIELVSDVQLVDGTDITILMRCFLKQTNVEVAFGKLLKIHFVINKFNRRRKYQYFLPTPSGMAILYKRSRYSDVFKNYKKEILGHINQLLVIANGI